MQTRAALRLCSSFALLFLLLGTTGCPPRDKTPAPPSSFAVAQSPGVFDDVFLSWTPPVGPITGYEAEGRMGDGPWESLGAIDADVIGGTLTFEASVPELTWFTFRIRSLNGKKASDWVEARYLRALRWPVALTFDHAREGLRLAWTNASTAATGLRVSRRFGQSWQVMAELPATAQSFVDAEQLFASQWVGYRISATAGDVEGFPAEQWDQGYPPVAVFDLTATPEAGGVRLRWVNPPLVTGPIEIQRAEGLVVAYFSDPDPVVLPSSATEYLDPVPGGSWTWNVVTHYPEVPAAPWAQVRSISNPLGGAVALQGSLVSLPDASAMASDGQGVLGFALGGSFYPPATGSMGLRFLGGGAPPDVDLGTSHGFAPPQIAFDPAGHPHAVLLRPAAAGPLVRLVHVRHDGSAWSEEEIAQRPLDDPTTVRFALDAEGALHVAWSTRTGSVRAEYARAEAGAFAIEDLTAVVPDDARVAAIDVDGLGSASVALGSQAAGWLLARRGATWDAETIPLDGFVGLRRSPAGLEVAGGQCVGPISALTGEIVVVERTAGGWGPAQLVHAGQCLPVESLALARSADGARTVLWGSANYRLELDLREGDAWTHVDTRPSVWPTSAAWFDASGKLHVLARSDGYPEMGGTVPYVQYVEY